MIDMKTEKESGVRQASFRIDKRIKAKYDAYVKRTGLPKERVNEALVFMVVIKEQMDAKAVFALIQEASAWKSSPANSRVATDPDAALNEILDTELGEGAGTCKSGAKPKKHPPASQP